MVEYDLELAKKCSLEFCRFPVPRPPIAIVRHLRSAVPNFFPRTESKKVVFFLRKNVLRELIFRNLILEYIPTDTIWPNARRLITHYYSREPGKSPRKLARLYQINFLNLVDTPWTYTLPAFKDINLDMVALLYKAVKGGKFEHFTFDLLNLFMCYAAQPDQIRIQLYKLDFTEREAETLEKALERSAELKPFFKTFPLAPNLNAAFAFLEKL